MVISGFYFCSYDQMFIESTWLIVMDINPVVYQWIILFRNGFEIQFVRPCRRIPDGQSAETWKVF